MGKQLHDKYFPQQLTFLIVASDDDDYVCEVLQEKTKKRFPPYVTANFFGGFPG